MALSVSGFPEPSRQSTTQNEIFASESPQDGSGKATLMNSPRLRGLFGANSTPSKKPDTKNQATSSKYETEGDAIQPSVNNTTPPTTPSLSFSSTSFEPLSQKEYEMELQLPMNAPLEPPRGPASKRPQLPTLPRKITPSPVRLSPSLARLEIGGAWTRSPPTLHAHSKPSPPSVVVQEWGAKGAEGSSSSTQQSRPLPSVPASTSDTGKIAQNAVAGPSRLPSAPVAIAGPSRHVNAVASSSNYVNAVAGSSKHPNALTSSSLPTPTTATAAPTSKVLISQPTPQRAHKPNSPSFSMRYQPLIADPPVLPSDIVSNNSANICSPIRPLPRIPAAISTSSAKSSDSTRYYPPPAKVKRPKTSPSSITGFSIPSGSKTPTSLVRSPFDNITTTWARPTVQRANSPPLPISNGKGPRARSHSRPRRDRSLDSYNSRAAQARLTASSAATGGSTWVTDVRRPISKTIPSPTIGGARPLPKKAATLDQLPHSNKTLQIQTSNVIASATSKVFSPTGKRSQPPSPPTGPVKPRTKPTPSPIASPTIHAPTPSVKTLPPLLTEVLVQPPTPAIAPTSPDESNTYESQSLLESPLHSHPIDVLTDNESLLYPPVSPITAESPIEVFVDDQDLSTVSRDPSPIRYARPDSRGNLSSSSNDDDFEISSSSSSSRSSSPNRRRRTQQLRSYRNSYRPHARMSPPHIPYRTESPTAAPEQIAPALPETPNVKKKEPRKPRSYFGGAASAPGTRASSPERKSRSRQPRRLAEAVSSALEDVRNRGRGPSTSPKRKSTKSVAGGQPSLATPALPSPPPVVEESDVLDISLPSLSRRETTETMSSSTSENVGGSSGSGGRRSIAGGWSKVISKMRTEGDHSSSGSLSIPHLSSSLVTAVELDGAETPYMWVSASKPPVTPAPFIPLPPSASHQHRRADSLSLEDYKLLSRQHELDIELDKHGVTCGLALGGGGGMAAGGKAKLSDGTSTPAASTSRPASSAISTTFSGFSLPGRSNTKKKKRTTSVAVPTPSSASAVEQSFAAMDKGPFPGGYKYSEKSYPSESDLPAVVARRILRSVDQDGDVWEREQETAVVDIIPHLRNLKASKS